MASKSNTADFIRKAIEVHGQVYDYSSTVYINSRTPVTITCSNHGDFKQTPQNHTNSKSGCPKCSNKEGGDKRRSDAQTFISKSIKVHNSKYDYSSVDYINVKTRVIITCKDHGDFTQTPRQHLQGHGCKQCADLANSISRNKGVNFFIARSNIIHNDKYDYDLVTTVANNPYCYVDIICPIHGTFTQSCNTHLNGHGCPKCGSGLYCESYFEKNPSSKTQPSSLYVFELYNNMERFIKVGITQNDPIKRTSHIPNKYNVNIVNTFDLPLKVAYNIEQQVITLCNSIIPQIKFGGHTECIIIDDKAKVLDIIAKSIDRYRNNLEDLA